MTRSAPSIPDETDLLCEACGYTLNGLPNSGNCPECGQPIALSSDADHRRPTSWDDQQRHGFRQTTLQVLFRPTHFYRSLATRASLASSASFARVHWIIASILFALVFFGHADWYLVSILNWRHPSPLIIPVTVVACYVMLSLTTLLAAHLTSWEAGYRGLRIPVEVALRSMHFHAAHYLPVGLIALFTVYGYQWAVAQGWLPAGTSATTYLYVLCGEVVVGAGYLFNTYWIGMRNIMYANR